MVEKIRSIATANKAMNGLLIEQFIAKLLGLLFTEPVAVVNLPDQRWHRLLGLSHPRNDNGNQ
jgi:hypothetical protein